MARKPKRRPSERELGTRVYEKLRARLEKNYRGKCVYINVRTGQFFAFDLENPKTTRGSVTLNVFLREHRPDDYVFIKRIGSR